MKASIYVTAPKRGQSKDLERTAVGRGVGAGLGAPVGSGVGIGVGAPVSSVVPTATTGVGASVIG